MRHYITPSWTGAAEDHTLWSGESPDDRKRPSRPLNGHFKPNGAANIGKYSDDKIEAKANAKQLPPELELEYKLFPQQQALNKIDAWEKQVEAKYLEDGDEEDYKSAMNALTLKRARAWKSLCKAKGWPLNDPEELDEAETDVKLPSKIVLTPAVERLMLRVWWVGLAVFILWANW